MLVFQSDLKQLDMALNVQHTEFDLAQSAKKYHSISKLDADIWIKILMTMTDSEQNHQSG